MPGAGAARFFDPDDYQARLPYATTALVVTEPEAFDARMVWAKLPNLFLLSVQEIGARVAYISLPRDSLFLSFSTQSGQSLIWNGIELSPQEIIFHGSGERSHQRLCSTSHWGMIALAPAFMASYGSSFAGRKLITPATGRILRPSPKTFSSLFLLQARIARMIELRPVAIGNPELGRSIEQEFLQSLVPCLTESSIRFLSPTESRNVEIMAAFEAIVAGLTDRHPSLLDLSQKLGISDRALRACCADFLGISPSRYMLLRRLRLARNEMRRADPTSARVGEIARQFGFSEVGRFSVVYRETFGESPLATLRRPHSLALRSGSIT